ncbi:MAG TPA: lysylphosphatidylglycerol synthase transmembrane domain-containing protein, partial [bacterium]|nr:lysylphosphatidylglycerol synthase transmembrane domain-containing protein [bacterium]
MQKKTVLNLVRVFVTVGFFALLFWKMRGDLSSFADAVKNAQVIWLVPAFVVFAVVSAISVIRWRLLLEVHAINVPYAHLVKYFFIGLFFNNFMLGLTGGDVVKAYYISRETQTKKAEAAITVLVDRIVGMFALISVAVVALLFHLGDPRLGKASNLILIMFAAFSLSSLVFVRKDIVKKIPFFDQLYALIPFRDMIHRLYHALYAYRDHKKVLLITFLYSIVLQVVMIFVTYGIGRAFGITQVPLYNFFLFIPIISTISALPISVGGLGVGESAYVYFFNIVYPQSAKYLAMALGLRLVSVVWGLVGG